MGRLTAEDFSVDSDSSMVHQRGVIGRLLFSPSFVQVGKHPWTKPHLPSNSLVSYTLTHVCLLPTISSLETRQSTTLDPEQLQMPIFAFSVLACGRPATLTTHPKSSPKPFQSADFIK